MKEFDDVEIERFFHKILVYNFTLIKFELDYFDPIIDKIILRNINLHHFDFYSFNIYFDCNLIFG
jgi:hypothetical protein